MDQYLQETIEADEWINLCDYLAEVEEDVNGIEFYLRKELANERNKRCAIMKNIVDVEFGPNCVEFEFPVEEYEPHMIFASSNSAFNEPRLYAQPEIEISPDIS